MVNNPQPPGKAGIQRPQWPSRTWPQASNDPSRGQRLLGVEVAQKSNKLVGPGNTELLIGPQPIGDHARSLDVELKRRSFDGLAGHRVGAYLALARAELGGAQLEETLNALDVQVPRKARLLIDQHFVLLRCRQ